MRPISLSSILFATGLAVSVSGFPQMGPGPVVTSSLDEGVQTVESMPQIAPSSTGISIIMGPGPVITSDSSISGLDSSSTTLANSTTTSRSTNTGTSTRSASTTLSPSTPGAGFSAAQSSRVLVTSLFALCAVALF
ncbi:SubName: Full=Uncharacterized protein {ECO:0000313/EMBL:CCA72506.1} [Serendipita indica DSM 11827]|uniref:Uncharacterized protein n=1 Tax=Serendipita indica (strain DSM 11827) TaxID=1109443 RepID=G4TMG3_SERID|nr:SubName: Full=Uncharacterized protein {ECO:0000313/EMBL:CCA72506.1} [Serendipita indica DSM 11827]CCA72506.1 hypothetical protein PIIN_06443 [Serendipita indica DSM 11827]